MTVLDYKDEKVTLTEMEHKTYEAVKEVSEMEDCYAANPEEVSLQAEIPMNQIRGVISSLVKKGVCYVDELITGCGKWVILFEEVNW